jgi:hypothetical protein
MTTVDEIIKVVKQFTEMMRPVLNEKERAEIVPADVFIIYIENHLSEKYGDVRVFAITITKDEVKVHFMGDTNGVVKIKRGGNFDVRILEWPDGEAPKPAEEDGEYEIRPNRGDLVRVFKVHGTEYVLQRNYYAAFIIRDRYKVSIETW